MFRFPPPPRGTDRSNNGLNGRGYYKIEVQNQDGDWKAVRGAAFQGSKVHVLDVGKTEATMSSRDKQYLIAHNKRRKEWHATYNTAYVPLRWSKGLRDSSMVRQRSFAPSEGQGVLS